MRTRFLQHWIPPLVIGLAALVILAVAYQLWQAGRMQAQARAAYEDRFSHLVQLDQIAHDYARIEGRVTDALTARTSPAAAAEAIVLARGRLHAAWLEFRDGNLSAADRAIIIASRALLAEATQAVLHSQDLLVANDLVGLRSYGQSEAFRSLAQIRGGLLRFAEDESWHALFVNKAENEHYRKFCWLSGVIIYLALAAAVWAGIAWHSAPPRRAPEEKTSVDART